jgi:8-oxo-dGTP pyrophosphatase MutT (NUDIX family)
MNKKIMTLCCVYNDTHILLGLKKCGLGIGNWNGFGGKVRKNETIKQAARRELIEETGIKPGKIDKRGIILFEFESPASVVRSEKLEVHIFSTNVFEGKPREAKEMKPRWFPLNKIPYKKMWADDIFWLPLMLSGKNFKGRFLFDNKGKKIIKHELREI